MGTAGAPRLRTRGRAARARPPPPRAEGKRDGRLPHLPAAAAALAPRLLSHTSPFSRGFSLPPPSPASAAGARGRRRSCGMGERTSRADTRRGEGEVAAGEAAAPLLLPAPRTAGQTGEALQRHEGRSGRRARAETWRRRRSGQAGEGSGGSGSRSKSRQARRARPHWLRRVGGGMGGQRRAGGRAGGKP
ncbi:unnamed protein product [Coccothraustes coccothraustes]